MSDGTGRPHVRVCVCVTLASCDCREWVDNPVFFKKSRMMMR